MARIKLGKKNLEVRRTSSWGRFRGLMFRTSDCDNLLFEFGSEKVQFIHSLFVFFPFLAVWLDGKNNIVKSEIVNPFKFSISSKYAVRALVEIPFNKKNRKIISFFVGKGKV